MRKVIGAIGLLCLFLSGCGGPQWSKPGVSQRDAESALSKCQYEMGLNKVSPEEQRSMLSHCMKGKGFRYY